jgi:hypothetical protein
MERTMRLNLRAIVSTITGRERRQTSRPTSLMLTTQFVGLFVLATALYRRLAQPLDELQLQYLDILELTPEAFLNPFGLKLPTSGSENDIITENSPRRCGM